MNWTGKMALMPLLAAASLVATGSARASIMTFEIEKNGNPNLGGSGGSLETDFPLTQYGDNVSAASGNVIDGADTWTFNYGEGNGFTPNVVASFDHGTDAVNNNAYRDIPGAWNDGVDFLYGLVNTTAERKFWITLTPDAGYGVRLNSFELRDYPALNAPHTVEWNVFQDTIGGASLASGTSNVPANGSDEVNTGLAGFYTGTIVLELHHTAGHGEVLALDNINFDQVPEPASSALALAAIGCGLLRRRRS